MNSTDAEIIRNIRRELNKRPLDATRMDIQVVNGRITLAGIVMAQRDKPETNVQQEMDMLSKLMLRDRLVREVSLQARVIEPEKEDKDQDGGPRGRMRHGH